MGAIVMAAKKRRTSEKDQVDHGSGRQGKAMSIYIDEDISPALEAYKAAQKIPSFNKAIINYALKKFLMEEGFYPPKPE